VFKERRKKLKILNSSKEGITTSGFRNKYSPLHFPKEPKAALIQKEMANKIKIDGIYP